MSKIHCLAEKGQQLDLTKQENNYFMGDYVLLLSSFSVLKYFGKTHPTCIIKKRIVENQVRKKCAQNKILNDRRDNRSLKRLLKVNHRKK